MRFGLVRDTGARRLSPQRFNREAFAHIWRTVKGGFDRAAPQLEAKAQQNVAAALRGNRVAKSVRARVYARDRNRFPTMRIASKVPWLAVHERGAIISGSMLIPFGKRRMARAQWRSLIDNAMQEGRAYFRKNILYVRPRGKGDGLSRFRTAERERRKAAGGPTRIGRSEAVPVAVRVRRVTVRKRTNVEQVARSAPAIIRREAFA